MLSAAAEPEASTILAQTSKQANRETIISRVPCGANSLTSEISKIRAKSNVLREHGMGFYMGYGTARRSRVSQK